MAIGIGMLGFTQRAPGDGMAVAIWSHGPSWTLTALPLFLWMGEILFRTKLSEDMFKGLSPLAGTPPGRLLHTNIIGCTFVRRGVGLVGGDLRHHWQDRAARAAAPRLPESMALGTWRCRQRWAC